MDQTIEVIIGKDGEVKIHVQGVQGESCLALTAELEAALGGDPNRQFTQEYFSSGDGESMGESLWISQ